MNIIITILAISLLVFIHELGHFLVAILFKVKVETFSIGFGPKLFSWERGGTVYAVSLIPLGGYVKMKGENAGETSEDRYQTSEDRHQTATIGEFPTPASTFNTQHTTHSDAFCEKKWWQRALIAFAGPFFSLLLGFVLIYLSFIIGHTYSDLSPIVASAEHTFLSGDRVLSVNGMRVKSYSEIFSNVKENAENTFVVQRDDTEYTEIVFIATLVEFYNALTPVSSNIVGEVSPGLPAWKAGLQVGDRILTIDGVETHTWQDIRNGIISSQNDAVTLEIQRADELIELIVYPEVNPLSSEQNKIIGITQHQDMTFHERYGLLQSAKYSAVSTVSLVYMNYYALYMLAKNPANFKNSVGGPVMIYYMTTQTSQRGFSDLCLFVATLSILLMIMNLLPIPVLDGGQIFFCIIEGIFKKPIPLKVQIVLQQIGFLILILLMFFAFFSDIGRFMFRVKG